MLQGYNQDLTDQFLELVNFTGTGYIYKEKMLSLFLQQNLDPLRRENWKNFCEKMVLKYDQKKSVICYMEAYLMVSSKKVKKQKQAML